MSQVGGQSRLSRAKDCVTSGTPIIQNAARNRTQKITAKTRQHQTQQPRMHFLQPPPSSSPSISLRVFTGGGRTTEGAAAAARPPERFALAPRADLAADDGVLRACEAAGFSMYLSCRRRKEPSGSSIQPSSISRSS